MKALGFIAVAGLLVAFGAGSLRFGCDFLHVQCFVLELWHGSLVVGW